MERAKTGWIGIIICIVSVVVLIMVMQEFAQQRCSTPFWRGFGIAMGACR